MKILTIVGARPQFIKAAAVSRAIAKFEDVSEVIVHTGQHFDKNMSDVFFEEMHIPKPDHHLHINSLSHGAMTGRMLEGIEGVILKEKPDTFCVIGLSVEAKRLSDIRINRLEIMKENKIVNYSDLDFIEKEIENSNFNPFAVQQTRDNIFVFTDIKDKRKTLSELEQLEPILELVEDNKNRLDKYNGRN